HELTSIGGTMDGSGNILTTYSSFSYSYLVGTASKALLQTVDILDPVNHNATYHRVYTYNRLNRLTVADVTQNGSEVQKRSAIATLAAMNCKVKRKEERPLPIPTTAMAT